MGGRTSRKRPAADTGGCGFGKTRVITYRIAHLIANRMVAPWNIVAVTFTNKAADEMRDRVARLLAERAGGVTIGTFHRTCAEMLRRNSAQAGLDRNFPDLRRYGPACGGPNGDEGPGPDAHAGLAGRGAGGDLRAKDELRTHFEYAEYAEGHIQEMIARIYRRYEQRLAESGGLDFGDLIMRAVNLLRDSPRRARVLPRQVSLRYGRRISGH